MTKRLTAFCLVTAALVLLAGMLAPPLEAAAPQKVKLQIQTPYPTSFPYVQRVVKMWQRIKTISGGQVDVTFFPPGGIVPAYSEWDAMQKGTLDGAFTVPSDVRGVFGPLGDLFNQYPGGPASEEMVAWIYYGNGKTMLQELIESKGFSNVQVIGVANLSLAEDELWVKKKIETPEDYKGLKVRTYGQWGKVLEAVGASVVTLPGGEVYQAMERGVIDACELGTSADNESLHINEVAKIAYYPGVHSPGNVHYVFFNKKSWAKLPPEYQQLIEREILSTAFENYLAGAVENAAARERMRAKGTQFLELPMNVQKFLVQKTDVMWDDVAKKDAAFAKVYKDQATFLAKHRALIGEIQPNLQAIRGAK
jgi:TRAP-type mannitol/chloroaromatic compound transport system substrate-binding protein